MAERKGAGTGRIAAAIALLLLSAMPAAASGLQPGPVSGDPIWTDRPVRIDRKKQSYERIAVPRAVSPLRLTVTPQVAVFDSTSFRQNGRVYVLTGAVAVDPKKLCRGTGRIAACGQQARLYLKRLIANRALTCTEDYRAGALSLVTCSVQEKDLAETLVEKGAAWAAIPRLASKQRAAMAAPAGIWTDTQCRDAGRCLPERRR